MKNTIFILVITSIALIGCNEDLLDKYPVTTLNPETFWQNGEEAEMAVNALYGHLPGHNQRSFDNMTETAIFAASAGQELVGGQVDETSDLFQNWWEQHYRAVSAANRFLEDVELVPSEEITAEDLARMKAEARFIRAVNYTYLVNYFGDVPFFTKSLQVSEASAISRTSRQVVIDFIESELTSIVNDLPLEYSGGDIGRITRGAALAWKARAMMWFKQYQKAADAAKAVMDLGIYGLHTDYEGLFLYESEYSNDEVILERIHNEENTTNWWIRTAPRSLVNIPGYGQNFNVERNLVDAYETVNGLAPDNDPAWDSEDPYRNRDPRLQATVWLPVFNAGSYADTLWGTTDLFDPRPGSGTPDEVRIMNVGNMTGFLSKKYSNIEDLAAPELSGQNYIILRYADVLLMYAEAKNEISGPDQSIYDAVNDIRNRVGLPDLTAGLSKEEMREKIRHERMIELALEGWRFYDIRRWDIAQDLMTGFTPAHGMYYRDIVTGDLEEVLFTLVSYNFPRKNEDHTYPVPWYEYNLNPNLLPQNEGW
jgi:hypothetical protein